MKRIFVILMLITMLTSCSNTDDATGNETNYQNISELKKYNERVNTKELFFFNDVLYGRSFAIIDYAGGSEPMGTINLLISSELIPQYNGETNQEYLTNCSVYDVTSTQAVISYNGEYILFENVKS